MLQHDSLKAFTDSLDANAKPFPLKVMGPSRPNVQYTATMLADVYQDTLDPDTNQPPIAACFGSINRRGATLAGGKHTYSEQILPAGDGSNTFQGDIFLSQIDLAPWGCRVRCKYAMVVSHSCDINPVTTIIVCPVFLESEVSQTLMEFIKGKPSPNYKVELQDMLRNQQHRILGLPPHGSDAFLLPDEPILVPLSLVMPLSKDKIGKTVLRLTYRANSYFQMRLATLLVRDVQRSDETRDF